MVLAGPREYHIGDNRRDFQGAFFITLLECDRDQAEAFLGGGTWIQKHKEEFDIVVYGATGFTGALVAEYLHEAHGDIKWAIAGRSQNKLDAVKQRLDAPNLPTLVADSDSTEDMTRLAAQSRVIISTVGPYARYGTTLLEACAAEGTHYCDLTGEPQWMASVFERVSDAAEESGARLIHCCGFEHPVGPGGLRSPENHDGKARSLRQLRERPNGSVQRRCQRRTVA